MTLHLRPETADALASLASMRGMSVEDYLAALVTRERQTVPPVSVLPGADSNPTGAALVAAMQTSPHKDVSIEPARYPLPVQDVRF